MVQVQGQKPSPPTRGLSPSGDGGEEEGDEEEDAEEDAGVNVADLVPRNDIR